MITLDDVTKIKKGDAIILGDFHTMEEMGSSYDGVITQVHHWNIEDGKLRIIGMQVDPNEDISLMVTAYILDGELHDVKLFRRSEENVANDSDMDITKIDEDNPDAGPTFANSFSVVNGDEDEPTEYVISRPYPFFSVKKNDGNQVAICGFLPTEEVPEDYWAKNCLVEWYAYGHEDPEEGLLTMWLGWDCRADEFEILHT